jgi:hypothetical protein
MDKIALIYEKRDDGYWQVSWWEDKRQYGGAGETKWKALECAFKLKVKGRVIAIDWNITKRRW